MSAAELPDAAGNGERSAKAAQVVHDASFPQERANGRQTGTAAEVPGGVVDGRAAKEIPDDLAALVHCPGRGVVPAQRSEIFHRAVPPQKCACLSSGRTVSGN